MLEFREVPVLWKCPSFLLLLCGEPGSRAPCLQTLSKLVRLRCGPVPWCRGLTGSFLGTDAWDVRMMLGASVSLSLSVLPKMGLSLSEHWCSHPPKPQTPFHTLTPGRVSSRHHLGQTGLQCLSLAPQGLAQSSHGASPGLPQISSCLDSDFLAVVPFVIVV